MKIIGLTQGKFALIDDNDLSLISQYKWYAIKTHNGVFYAKNPKMGWMHHMIAGEKCLIDHKNRNGLDNQRHNLRKATQSENSINRKPKNKFKGITQRYNFRNGQKVYCNCWSVSVKKDGVYHRRTCKSELEAARAYNELAKKHHGAFAILNDV